MLVDHRIKLDVEPELKLPRPRSIQRRPGRGFLFRPGHILLLPFIAIALILLLVLLNSSAEIILGRKPIELPFFAVVFYALFWNCCTAIVLWKVYGLRLVNRWLVVHGHATLGRITGFTRGAGRGDGELHVHYEFSLADGSQTKGKTLVGSMKAWKELKEGNTVITVMYSEKNPKWNVPYTCADYEAVNDAEKITGPARGSHVL